MEAMQAQLSAQARRIQRRNRRDSNPKIDLLRVLGMFFVVYAHITGHGMRLFGAAPVSSVYVIQLFIFCAGYFYKTETDGESCGAFLKSRARAYLLPYFFWNLLYGLICTMLKTLGIIQYGKNLSLYTLFVSPWLEAEQFEFNYASWFLLSLFMVVLITWAFRALISRLRPMDRLDHLLLLFFAGIAAAAIFLLGQGNYHTGWEIGLLRPLTLLPFYQMGYVYRTYWEKALDRWYWGLVLALVQVLLCLLQGSAFQAKMVYGYFVGNPVLLVLTAACMVLLLNWAAGWVGKVVHGKALKFTAHCSMYIMQHHLFVLFVIHMALWILDHFFGLPGFSAAAFHTDRWYLYKPLGSPTVLIYIAVCYALPVLVHWGWERMVLRAAKKHYPEAAL